MKATNFRPADAGQIVDVRTSHEWDAGHLEGTIHIPLNELADRMSELNQGQPVVAVCRTGVRSQRAAEILQSGGFDAESLDGGLKAVAEAGQALVASDGGAGVVADQNQEETLSPELVGLRNNFLEIAFALQDRFGDERTEEQELEFMREWLANRGKSPQEIETLLSQDA